MARRNMIKLWPAIFTFLSFSFVSHYWWVIYSKGDLPLQNFPTTKPQNLVNDICSCSNKENKTSRPQTIAGGQTLCQSLVTDRGIHQRVVSYYVDGDVNDDNFFRNYYLYLHKIAAQVAEFYPGWVMRIYHNYNAMNVAYVEHLCPTYCRYSHVDLCNVTDLSVTKPNKLKADLDKISPFVWRLLPLADPAVDVVLSRNLNSALTGREADAVIDWLYASQATLHIMRDHPDHGSTIMGGLWGSRALSRRKKELVRSIFMKMKEKGASQNVAGLAEEILNLLYSDIGESDILRHDSYYCTEFPRSSQPFPTQRNGFEFVGGRLYDKHPAPLSTCPLECRPNMHKDWEYC